jgi:Lhr-like helicase
MRLLIIFAFAFIGGYLFTESWATEPKPVSDIDALLKKIQQNTQAVGQATKQAHEVSEKLVEAKVVEKEQLKEAVVNAEKKAEAVVQQMQVVQDQMEVYAVKMVGAGLDTTTTPIEFKGVIYDAYLNYLSEGGKEDFDYFRMYLWQQK